MTNIKYLRRMMRSGLFFFSSTTSTGGAHHQSASANKLKLKPAAMQSSNWKSTQQAGASLSLQGSQLCLPASSSAKNIYSPAYIDEGQYVSAYHEEEEEEKRLARRQSCSKLQGKQLVPSFKRSAELQVIDPLRTQSCKLHAINNSSPAASLVSRYPRSWSAPSLHIGRHIIKLPQKARSSSQLDGKRAPKAGHVAVYLVEAAQERHVVPIAYLSHPHFQALLQRAESEFGFRQQGPGLRIPCSLSELRQTLHLIAGATH